MAVNKDKIKRNKDYNKNLKTLAKDPSETKKQINALVKKVVVKTDGINVKTILEINTDTSTISKIIFNGNIPIVAGDKVSVIVDLGEIKQEKPEYNKDKNVWELSDKKYLVERPLKNKEIVEEINKLNSEGKILASYIYEKNINGED